MRYALYKEVTKRRRHKRKKRKLPRQGGGDASPDSSDEGSDEDDEGDQQDEAESRPERMEMPAQPPVPPNKATPASQGSTIWQDDSQDLQMSDAATIAPSGESSGAAQNNSGIPPARCVSTPCVDPEPELCFAGRVQMFRSKVANLFSSRLQDEEQIFLTELLEMINHGLPTSDLFGTTEATAICQIMSDSDELMLSDGIVYKV